MRQIRVVSLDGTSTSGGSGFIAIGMLRQLRDMCAARNLTSILNVADVFAGTSGGAVNACLFAMNQEPEDALDRALAFWEGMIEITNKLGVSVLREVGAVLGQRALVSTSQLRSYFISHFGLTTRLGDLKKKVVIPAFQLDNGSAVHRAWKPKIYHNFGGANEPDRDERVVDVIMRSGSPPIMTPVYQGLAQQGSGYVDGGVFANNPSLCGLAQVICELTHGDWKGEGTLQDVLMLALGSGDAPVYLAPEMKDGFGDWGYGKWILNPCDLGSLVYLMLDSGVMSATFIAGQLMHDNYRRLNPILPAQIRASNGKQVAQAVVDTLALPNTGLQLDGALDWLVQSGWLAPPPPPPPPPSEPPATGGNG